MEEVSSNSTAAMADLPPALLRCVNNVLRAAATWSESHAEYAYSMAMLARAVSGKRIGERSAAEVCALAANLGRSALEDYVAVSAHFTPWEVRLLFGLRDGRGETLTLSRLLEVARAPRRLREQLEREMWAAADVRRLREFATVTPDPAV